MSIPHLPVPPPSGDKRPSGPAQAAIPRPKRWDEPFDSDMTEADVDRLLATPPFSLIDLAKFPKLRDLLRNDTRIVKCRPGDVLLRKGDYGDSAFLLLSGTLRVSVGDALAPLVGQQESPRKGFLQSLAQLWTNPRVPEARDPRAYTADAIRRDRETARICLQDVPGVLRHHETGTLKPGDIFGEMGALLRTPRAATVFAEGEATLLEIRWQGLRDLRLRDEGFRGVIENAYRAHTQEFLKATLFGHLTPEERDIAAATAQFERFGEFEWHKSYAAIAAEGIFERLAREPVILLQGKSVQDLILVLGGFVRVSRNLGHGEQTVAYLGKGHAYGLDELAHNWRMSVEPVTAQRSLRAVGYADILRLPRDIVERFLLRHLEAKGRLPPLVEALPGDDVPPPTQTGENRPIPAGLRMSAMKLSAPPLPLPGRDATPEPGALRMSALKMTAGDLEALRAGLAAEGTPDASAPAASGPAPAAPRPGASAPAVRRQDHSVGSGLTQSPIETGLLEFLVENRIVNGTATMMINLDRCTRCDDCVRACASTHEGNPRFVRQGPTYDRRMIATACMHCVDPVCMLGCPTGAIHREPGGGQVVINDRTCIGCSMCSNSCPYQAIRMVPIRDPRGNPIVDEATGGPIVKATKCDLCATQPSGPACVRACPHDALVRADFRRPIDLAQWLYR